MVLTKKVSQKTVKALEVTALVITLAVIVGNATDLNLNIITIPILECNNLYFDGADFSWYSQFCAKVEVNKKGNKKRVFHY